MNNCPCVGGYEVSGISHFHLIPLIVSGGEGISFCIVKQLNGSKYNCLFSRGH